MSRTFTIDTTPPSLEIMWPEGPVWEGRPVVVTGRVERAEAVEVAGSVVPVRSGRFTHVFPSPPS